MTWTDAIVLSALMSLITELTFAVQDWLSRRNIIRCVLPRDIRDFTALGFWVIIILLGILPNYLEVK